MVARAPEEIHRLFAERFKAGDLEGLLELYEEGAAFAARPDQVLTGKAAIREGLGAFLGMHGEFVMKECNVIASGDLALLCSEWSFSVMEPDGKPTMMAGCTTDVARRQADGSWLIAIDNPWGTG
jgi:uncharacterized protein (TIGR02246 family)